MGKRLRPLTDNRPKPLIPFFNRLLITRIFESLTAVGIERAVVNTHHCASQYDTLLGLKNGVGRVGELDIQCVHEPVLLETGGGIRNASDYLGNEPVLIHNGDIFTTVDLAGLMQAHDAGASDVTVHLRSHGGPLQVGWDESAGRVCDFRNALGNPGSKTCLFSGVYVVEPSFVSRIPPDEIISVVPVFLEMLRSGVPIAGYLDDSGVWADLGNRDAYLDAHANWFREAGCPQILIHPSASVSIHADLRGFVSVGAHAVIESGAMIENSVIWDGAKIASGARLKRCIVRDHQIARGDLIDQDI